jgi:hypothetical protein
MIFSCNRWGESTQQWWLSVVRWGQVNLFATGKMSEQNLPEMVCVLPDATPLQKKPCNKCGSRIVHHDKLESVKDKSNWKGSHKTKYSISINNPLPFRPS